MDVSDNPGRKLYLIVPYYRPESAERRDEIDNALYINMRNIHFDGVTVLLEKAADEDHVRKLVADWISCRPQRQIITLTRKPLYSDYLRIASSQPHMVGQILLFANADVYFDGGESILKDLRDGEAVCLTRHEIDGTLNGNTRGCHDAWALPTPIPIALEQACQFPQGHWSCENRFAYELMQANYKVCNPCGSIRMMHNHKHDICRPNTTLFTAGPYAFVPQSELHKSAAFVEENLRDLRLLSDICNCSACLGSRPGQHEDKHAVDTRFAVFDEPFAVAFNLARTRCLENLAWRGWDKWSVLETGMGARGDITTWLDKRGAKLTCVDGRLTNVIEHQRRHPHLAHCAYQADLNTTPSHVLRYLNKGKPFDIVVCFGTLYHLSDPGTFLDTMAESCHTMVLETMVRKTPTTPCCDWGFIGEEAKLVNQSTTAKGCRPSLEFLLTELRKRFASVHERNFLPPHPEFTDRVKVQPTAAVTGEPECVRKWFVCGKSAAIPCVVGDLK